ncbi:hypothetical protein ACA910_019006 [Epithemia clementina (nom. ined.)]
MITTKAARSGWSIARPFVLLVALQRMLLVGRFPQQQQDYVDNTSTKTVLPDDGISLSSVDATPNKRDLQTPPQPHIDWTARIAAKRQWVQYIQSSLPQEAIHKPFPNRLPRHKCSAMTKATKHSWVIHSLPGTNQTKTDPPYQHKHAIIIPYRDRAFHLERFVEYTSRYLKYHFQPPGDGDQIGNEYDTSKFDHHFALYIVEQDDDELFNRALLTNAGLDHVAPETECVIQHDVDIVPAFYSPIPYHRCRMPVHLAARAETKDFKPRHQAHLGVVVSMHQQHWASINGMDSLMQGWGAEDDELFVRLYFLGLANCSSWPVISAYRTSNDEGNVFTAISESKQHHTRSPLKMKSMYANDARIKKCQRMGLSPSVISTGGWRQTKYHVVSRDTWDVSQNKSWQGFQEIHHIKIKVDKSTLEHCLLHCNTTAKATDTTTNNEGTKGNKNSNKANRGLKTTSKTRNVKSGTVDTATTTTTSTL